MAEYHLQTADLPTAVSKLCAGDRVLLSGTVYTSRDAAHKADLSVVGLPFAASLSA